MSVRTIAVKPATPPKDSNLIASEAEFTGPSFSQAEEAVADPVASPMSDAKDTVLLVDAVSPIKDEGIIVSQPEDEGFTASHVSEMTR